MSEFSFSSTFKRNEFSTHLFSHLFHLFFSIFSRPLYFSYFIFFSPYLLRLLSFLSPLFATTTLLLAALLTVTSPDLVQENDDSEFSKSKWGFLLSVYQSYIEWLRSKTHDNKDEEFGYLDEFEAYLVLFQQSICDVLEPKSEDDCSEGLEASPDAECSGEGREDFGPVEEPHVNSEENPIEKVDKVEATRPIAEVKSLETLFQETTEFEGMSCQMEDREVKPLDPEFSLRSESKVVGNRHIDAKMSTYIDGEYAAAVKVKSQMVEANIGSPESNWEHSGKVLGYNQALCSNLGSFGSMRREKEWRRTLACKLFEERHNVNGSEGMDMLWETYETDSIKVQQKSNPRKEKKGQVEYSEEEEEEDIEGKLCCLQALKFSAGKMNLGMGRPNFLKISKALKGIGWLHHASRHGRKGIR